MKHHKTSFFFTALFAFSTATVSPIVLADYENDKAQFLQGVKAVKKGDYQTAFSLWKPLAEQGNAIAQFNLGSMYKKGRGVKQDYAEAVKWFTKAAEQGDAIAQFNLGLMYKKGRGVKQDYAEAVKWYTKSAEQGDASTQYNLGLMYYNGQGVKQDYAEAV
ncbi:tetratricopeptide repeat protein, partial [Rodentibacter genomosp. 1]|uniref:tetratricopeptide repeat protein n=1 Tax=Rodentibacter genomosp. 1 TaxID=1908264 RepID=UPI00117BC7D1